MLHEKNILQHRLCIILLLNIYILSNMMVGYGKETPWSVGTIVNLFVREARLLHEGTGWCFTSLSMKDERKLIEVFYIQLSLVKMFYLNFNRKS